MSELKAGFMVGFWKIKEGKYINHCTGLSKEQVDGLKELKEGDTLVIYVNDIDTDDKRRPKLSLKTEGRVVKEENI